MTNNTIKAAFLAGIMGIALPAMATDTVTDPDMEAAVVESCEYDLSFDRSLVDFDGVVAPTVRYVSLTNGTVGTDRDCSLPMKQVKLTHMGQGYGSEAYSFEVVNGALDDNVLSEGETAVFKITMTPDSDDALASYNKTDLWILAKGTKDDGSVTWVKAKTKLHATEIAEYDASCTYGLSFDEVTYSFGALTEGSDAIKTPVLTNTGTCPVEVRQEYISGAETEGYTLEGGMGQGSIILPGEQVDYTVTFAPASADEQVTYNNTDIFVHTFAVSSGFARIAPLDSVKASANLNGELAN